MKKILILSMFCNKQLFMDEEAALRETWAKPIIDGEYPNIDFYGYTASTDGKYRISRKDRIIYVPSGDGLFDTAEKTMKCFRFITYLGIKYDYVFRTNTSTYVNVPLLNAFVQTLYDSDAIWSGVIFCPTDKGGPYPLCVFACGNSLLLSRYDVEMVSDPKAIEFAAANDHANEFNSSIAPEIFKDVIYKVDDNFMSFVMNSQYICKRRENHMKHYRSFCVIAADKNDPFDFKDYIAIGFRQVIPNENEQTLRRMEMEVEKGVHSHISHNENLDVVYDFIGMDLVSMYGYGFIPREECVARIKGMTEIPYLE